MHQSKTIAEVLYVMAAFQNKIPINESNPNNSQPTSLELTSFKEFLEWKITKRGTTSKLKEGTPTDAYY